MELLSQSWPVVIAGFFAGFVDAIGGGGGLISVPAFLAVGVPYPLLLGTNKGMAATGASVAAIRYARAGIMPKARKLTWFVLAGSAILAGAIGAAISELPIVLENLKYLVPILLVAVMAYLLKRWFWDERYGSVAVEKRSELVMESVPTQVGVATIAGYDGVFGPGAGTFFLSFLEKRGLGTVQAIAATKVFNLGSNIGALAFFASTSRVLWPVALMAAIGFMGGNYVGSGIVLQRGKSVVRLTVIVATSLLLVKQAWSAWN